MHDSKDADLILGDAIGDDIWRVGYGQFAGAVDAPRADKIWIVGKPADGGAPRTKKKSLLRKPIRYAIRGVGASALLSQIICRVQRRGRNACKAGNGAGFGCPNGTETERGGMLGARRVNLSA